MTTGTASFNLSREMLIAACAPDVEVAGRSWAAITNEFDSPGRLFTAVNRHPSSRLLPLLHGRIAELGIDQPVGQFLNGCLVESWGFNLRLFEQAVPVIAKLTEVGVEVTCIKGFALLGDAYPRHELRTMGDVDIVVREREMRRSRRILEGMGWGLDTPRWPSTTVQNWAYVHGSHSYPFSIHGSYVIDLHWRGARELTVDPGRLWEKTVPLSPNHPYASLPVRRPDDEWMVLILAMHAIQARNSNLVHPFADIASFLGLTSSSSSRRSIDWDRLARIASNELVSIRVDRVLGNLYSMLEIPEGKPPSLTSMVRQRNQRREHRATRADMRQNVDYTGSKARRLLVQLIQGTRAETPGLGPLRTARVFAARSMIAMENIVLRRRQREFDR